MIDENGKLINPEIRLEVSSRCNARCRCCPREKMKRPSGAMPTPLFRRLVDEAIVMGATTVGMFGFGEPLTDRDFLEKLKFCQKRGMTTNITTNGKLLTGPTAKKLLEYGISDIRFSAHGINRKNYEAVHKGLRFDLFKSHVRGIREMIAKGKYKTKLHITCMPLHNEDPELIRKKWEGFVDYLEIWKPHGWAGKVTNTNGGLKYRKIKRDRLVTCGRPFRGPVQVQSDGTVIPCCFMTDSEVVWGDTNKNTLLEILTGVEAQKFREVHRSMDKAYHPCNKCDQLNIGDDPLLYSNRRDVAGATSSILFDLKET